MKALCQRSKWHSKKKAARQILSNGSDVRLVSFVKNNIDKLDAVQPVKLALDDDADSYPEAVSKDRQKMRRVNDIQIDILKHCKQRADKL